MFRKPKRKQASNNLRKKPTRLNEDEDDDPDEESTRELLHDAKKRLKQPSAATTNSSSNDTNTEKDSILHSYETNEEVKDAKDLVTSTADYHPEGKKSTTGPSPSHHEDGIYRDTTRNAFHAGPLRAAAHVRVTARFDYQPDICKDYKETGFCGYGDTCIYLHDRTDQFSGWQLEQQWEAQQKSKREQQQAEMLQFATGQASNKPKDNNDRVVEDDGIPFACYICRSFFKQPVVTHCGHYFCESCIMNHVRTVSESCPVCTKDTGSVFHQPNRLLAKRRKLLGVSDSKKENAWELYEQVFKQKDKS